MLTELRFGARLLRRHPIVIVGILGLSTVSTYLRDRIMPREYEATSRIMLLPTGQGGQAIQDVLANIVSNGSDPDTDVANNLEILHSEPTAQKAAKNLGSRYPALANDPVAMLKLFGGRTVPSSNVIQVYARSSDPVQAAAIANAVTDAFMADNVSSHHQQVDQTIAFLDRQVKSMQTQLAAQESLFDAYQAQSGVLGGADQATQLEQAARQAKEQIDGLRSHLADLKARSTAIAHQLGLSGQRAARALELQTDPLLGQLRNQLLQAQTDTRQDALTARAPQTETSREQIRRLQVQIQRYIAAAIGPTAHPVALETLESPLLGELVRDETDARGLAVQVAQAQDASAQIQKQVGKFPSQEQRFLALQRRASVLQETYSMLLEKRVEAGMARELAAPSARIIQYATIPDIPIAPQKKKDFEMALFGGLLAGIMTALLFEYLETGSLSPAGISTALRSFGAFHDLILQNGQAPLRIVAHGFETRLAEQFRLLKHNVRTLAARRDSTQVVLMTPRFIPEQTVVLLNLAESFALGNQAVLLVDAHAHLDGLSVQFHCEAAPGLAEILHGQEDWRSFVQKTDNPHLDLLPHGHLAAWSLDETDPAQLAALLASWSETYAWVFLDVPPVLESTLGLLLATQIPVEIVLADHDRTRLRDLRAMTHLLDLCLSEPAGAIGLRVCSRLDLELGIEKLMAHYSRSRIGKWKPRLEA